MLAVISKCIKCGKPFAHGIFPEKVCDQCQIKESPKVWIGNGEPPLGEWNIKKGGERDGFRAKASIERGKKKS